LYTSCVLGFRPFAPSNKNELLIKEKRNHVGILRERERERREEGRGGEGEGGLK
jgi:hypothetical protein